MSIPSAHGIFYGCVKAAGATGPAGPAQPFTNTFILPANSFGSNNFGEDDGSFIGTGFVTGTAVQAAYGYGEYDVALVLPDGSFLTSATQNPAGDYWSPPHLNNPPNFSFLISDFPDDFVAGLCLFTQRCATPSAFQGTGQITMTVTNIVQPDNTEP